MITNGYLIFECRPGTPIDNQYDVQDAVDTDEHNSQGAPDTYGQSNKVVNKTEYSHVTDDKDSNSENDDGVERDK